MGRDKGLVQLAGRPLVQHVLDRVAQLGDEVCITTNRPQAYAFLGVPTASDPQPGLGALAGLRTALQAARSDTVLVVACDMPFLEPALLRHLLSRSGEAEVVIRAATASSNRCMPSTGAAASPPWKPPWRAARRA